MINRKYWHAVIEKAWKARPVIWLAGVRRVGKTCLTQSLDNVEYFDCELPRVRQMMQDPQDFWDGLNGKRVILDEIHRLDNPSQLLKIAADHYPKIRVIATGSSTLGASSKFRDTLAGRNTNLWLTPVTLADMRDFDETNLKRRLLHGGLPPFFLSDAMPEAELQEWMDAYWAKDIQELFRLEKRSAFQKLTELLMIQSGGMFEAKSLAQPCGISQPTVANYVKVLEETFVVHVIRPFHGRNAKEIVSAPKIYAFDTGFVCYYRGWTSLRPKDMGELWEHFVLNEIHAATQSRTVGYWRDKQKHEVDFIWSPRGRAPMAIECKWSAGEFNAGNLHVFRQEHPTGENIVVAHDVDRSFKRTFGGMVVHFENTEGLTRRLLS
ncbi:MAG: ATP-binding protein [Planctomycetaceae bacterium]|nr:MAG: ATP-binding protein [Planctomycetaceae bacterium]